MYVYASINSIIKPNFMANIDSQFSKYIFYL